jgi:hypothetical protein
MIGRSRVVVVCAWLMACGGAATEARAPKAPAAAPPAATAPEATPNVHAPPGTLAQFWVPTQETQTFSARTAIGKLARGPLFQAILPTLKPALPERYAPCLDALLQHSEELLVRGTEQHGYAVLSFAPQGLAAVRAACLGSVVPTNEPVSIAGAAEAYAGGDDVLAFVPPSTVLFGQKAEVQAALTPGHATAPMPPHFTLKGDELLGLRVDVAEPKIGVDASLASAPDVFSLEARASLPAEELAARIEQGFELFRGQAKERVKEAGGDATVQALLDGITLERQGSQLHAALAIRGSIDQQAHAIGQLAAMTVVATERYLTNAKAAESKAVMALIVKAYQYSLQESEAAAPKKARKLVSLPPVPLNVPRGEAYQSKAEDWKGWAALQFSLAEPQRYQYEVVAAKDGKTAQVIARGDLDGDGDLSVRTLTIELDPKTGRLTAKGMEEKKPLE